MISISFLNSPSAHPHYAAGWACAGNTPNRWYKQMVHEGVPAVPHANLAVYAMAEGLEVGSKSASAVWPRYRPPFDFTVIVRMVEITTEGPGHSDPEGETSVAHSRQ